MPYIIKNINKTKERRLRLVANIAAAFAAITLLLTSLTGCYAYSSEYFVESGDFGETIMIQIEMEKGGIIKLELYPDVAPITCANFVKLANEGFYDGLIFHRVIKNFMIQGGDPTGTGMGGSSERIKGEFASNGVSNNIAHTRGTISMARSQNANSASSQFFICHKDAPHLNGSYAAFGRVIEGIEVVDEIAECPTDKYDRPYEDMIIKTIRVIEE